jgi:hypothetical protein
MNSEHDDPKSRWSSGIFNLRAGRPRWGSLSGNGRPTPHLSPPPINQPTQPTTMVLSCHQLHRILHHYVMWPCSTGVTSAHCLLNWQKSWRFRLVRWHWTTEVFSWIQSAMNPMWQMKFLRKLPRIIISTVRLKPRCMTQLRQLGAHSVRLLVRWHRISAYMRRRLATSRYWWDTLCILPTLQKKVPVPSFLQFIGYGRAVAFCGIMILKK